MYLSFVLSYIYIFIFSFILCLFYFNLIFLLLFIIFLSFFFFFSFAFLQSLIGWFSFSLFFPFLLKHIHNSRVWEAFFGDILLSFLPKVRVEILILGQGLQPKSRGWAQKGLRKVGHDVRRDICLEKGFRNKGVSQIISMTRI